MSFPLKLSLLAGTILATAIIVAQASRYELYPAQEYPAQYSPYSYGYDIDDGYGNKQWRQEKSHNPQEVHGSYGYRDKSGIYREVVYVADKNGFRAHVKTNEPGVEAKDPAQVKMDAHPVAATYSYPQVKEPVYASTIPQY